MKPTLCLLLLALPLAAAAPPRPSPNPDSRLHRFSTTVEKTRPPLAEETRLAIAACRRDPSDAARAALRARVETDYNQVLARKRAKLAELERTARHAWKIDEMRAIVAEMEQGRARRIDQSMARFTDPRLRPGRRPDPDGFLPLVGAGETVDIACTPVTAADWALFTGHPVPDGRATHPATGVSFADALRYCDWRTARDPAHLYRLPTEDEWELAAGHMPKDADFNCGLSRSTTPVDAYPGTPGACGGLDFWGNCWEWTSTPRPDGTHAVKGGAYDSRRTDCRTESRAFSRAPSQGYPNVTFRLVRLPRP
jgi:hypothetical protein